MYTELKVQNRRQIEKKMHKNVDKIQMQNKLFIKKTYTKFHSPQALKCYTSFQSKFMSFMVS